MLLVLPVLLVLLVLLVLRSVDRSDDFSAGRAGVSALEWPYGCVRPCTAVYGRREEREQKEQYFSSLKIHEHFPFGP